jgi:hypothetical protein
MVCNRRRVFMEWNFVQFVWKDASLSCVAHPNFTGVYICWLCRCFQNLELRFFRI